MTRAAILLALSLSLAPGASAQAREALWNKIERGLEIQRPGDKAAQRLALADALKTLNIPSVSVALIDGGRLAFAHAWGAATPRTLYQAASLSKSATAVAALRLVEMGALALDRSVNEDQLLWRAPQNELTAGHPVTLRGLLSMTAGVSVPGYPGYEPGAPLPNLAQILSGAAPATSPPVEVVARPDSVYAYSGGGYEIVQALIEARTRRSFDDALREFVFRPAGMTQSAFVQPPPPALAAQAATGHYADGRALPGGWRIVPELAAGGLWSTPGDLAKLLIQIARAYRGDTSAILSPKTADEMLEAQNGGPYGLGGAVSGAGEAVVFEKRGQNVGYQSYMLIFPQTGQGIVVMTNSDNGSTLANALIRRAAAAYGWPELSPLED